jgi:serine/threonine-protein kinase HipA
MAVRKAEIRMHDRTAAWLTEEDDGFHFRYDRQYLDSDDAKAVSLTLPLRKEAYVSKVMFPFFDGLIPEGWLLDVAQKNWKLNERDRMGLLLTCCKDCVGAVSVHPLQEENAA